VNSGKELPDNFWDFSMDDLNDFEQFCEKASQKLNLYFLKKLMKEKENYLNLFFRRMEKSMLKIFLNRLDGMIVKSTAILINNWEFH
jgi:hypothetical protein